MDSARKGKKRVSEPDKWKSNIRKQARLKGREYLTAKGSIVPAVKPGELCRYV